MSDEVERYRWLSDGPLQEAGCLTVVPEGDLESVARAFGCDPASDSAATFATAVWYEPIDSDPHAWVSQAGQAAVVIEDNGFEGARAEVLRPASKTSPAGVAASIFWNVDGMVMFNAARRGKIVCSVELLDVDADELPRTLRPLAALTHDGSTDAVAIGAAMVAKFTGVDFGPADVGSAMRRTLTPVPEDFDSHGSYEDLLRDRAPQLHAVILTAGPDLCRRIASWSAAAAVAEAGIVDEPGVRDMLRQPGGSQVPVLSPALSAVLAKWQREQRTFDWESRGWVAASFLTAQIWAAGSLRLTAHPDPFQAAVQATLDATFAFSCTWTKRPGRWVEDETGRRAVYENLDQLPDRAQAFADTALEAFTAPHADGGALAGSLPTPFTAAQRAEFIRADQALQASGAFDEYQTLRSQHW